MHGQLLMQNIVIDKPYRFVAPYPGANERYRLKGGNDQLVSALVRSIHAGSIEMSHPLEAIWSLGDGRIGLRFGGKSKDVIADHVVLALPFTTLRETDYAGLSLSSRKRRAIETLAMGTNGKMNLQLNRSFAALDWSASFASDDPHYVTWDSTYGQTSPAPQTPVLTIYNGGEAGTSFPTNRAHAPANEPVIKAALDELGRGLEGIHDAFNGRAFLDFPYRPELIAHVDARAARAKPPLDLDPRVRAMCSELEERLAEAYRARTSG